MQMMVMYVGMCVGMINGPHEGGKVSYPLAWDATNGTYVEALVIVPELQVFVDGIAYFIWMDIFFSDARNG